VQDPRVPTKPAHPNSENPPSYALRPHKYYAQHKSFFLGHNINNARKLQNPLVENPDDFQGLANR
jgi:hypothetical protein